MIFDTEYIVKKINVIRKDDTIKNESDLADAIKNNTLLTETLLSAFTDLRLKISEHMRLDRVLFLFGNGASIYAGSKDTRTFSLSQFSNKKEYKSIGDIIQNIEGYGIEEQLNALITVRSYYNIMKDKKESIVSNLINEIKNDLIDNFVNSIDYAKLNLHEVFLLKLRSFGCLSRSSIYTPNYDLAFEYMMDKLRIEYSDGFSGFVNRVFDPRTLVNNVKTSIIKIHGSVNWKSEDDKIKEFQPRFSEHKVVIDDKAPVLIYPTSDKLYQTYSTPYSELMRHMLDEMGTGKNVIIVLGYKYGDDHINEILQKSIENPNNIYYFFLYNPNENSEFVERIKTLCESMPNINLLTGNILASFDMFVKYIMPALPEKTDQEKAFELLKGVLMGDEKQ